MDLVGEGGAASAGAALAWLGPVGVGGSTSRGGLFELCDSCLLCDPSMSSCCAEGAGMLLAASSSFVSPPELCGELAPCIPRPWASELCSVLSGDLLSLSPFARGVSTASSKASYAGLRLAVCIGAAFYCYFFQQHATYRLLRGRLVFIPQLHFVAHVCYAQADWRCSALSRFSTAGLALRTTARADALPPIGDSRCLISVFDRLW